MPGVDRDSPAGSNECEPLLPKQRSAEADFARPVPMQAGGSINSDRAASTLLHAVPAAPSHNRHAHHLRDGYDHDHHDHLLNKAPHFAPHTGTFTTKDNDTVEWRDEHAQEDGHGHTKKEPEGEEDLDLGGSSTHFGIRITILSVLCVLFGISNNITFFEMGQRMEDYPVFLLYFTTMAYTFLYFSWALFNAIFLPGREEPLFTYLLGASYQRLVCVSECLSA